MGLTAFPEGLDAKEFDNHLDNIVDMEYDFGWTLIDKKPIGFVFGSVAGPLVLLRDTTWMPTASPRNKIEHIVHLLNDLRKQMKIIFYSTEKDKDYYVHVAKHGITRRVGKLEDMGEHLTLWETRWQAQ